MEAQKLLSGKTASLAMVAQYLKERGFAQQSLKHAAGAPAVFKNRDTGQVLEVRANGKEVPKSDVIKTINRLRELQEEAERLALKKEKAVVPRSLQKRFAAYRQGPKITVYFQNFPNFQTQFEIRAREAASDAAYEQAARDLEERHKDLLDELAKLEKYKTLSHYREDIIQFTQDSLGFIKTFYRDDKDNEAESEKDFKARFLATIEEAKTEIHEIAIARSLRLLYLKDKGFVVTHDPQGGACDITRPDKPGFVRRITYLHTHDPDVFIISTRNLQVIEGLEVMSFDIQPEADVPPNPQGAPAQNEIWPPAPQEFLVTKASSSGHTIRDQLRSVMLSSPPQSNMPVSPKPPAKDAGQNSGMSKEEVRQVTIKKPAPEKPVLPGWPAVDGGAAVAAIQAERRRKVGGNVATANVPRRERPNQPPASAKPASIYDTINDGRLMRNLPHELHEDFYAVLNFPVITLAYHNFPEFKVDIRGEGKHLVLHERYRHYAQRLRDNYQEIVESLKRLHAQELTTKYGITIRPRGNGMIHFIQDDLGIHEDCASGSKALVEELPAVMKRIQTSAHEETQRRSEAVIQKITGEAEAMGYLCRQEKTDETRGAFLILHPETKTTFLRIPYRLPGHIISAADMRVLDDLQGMPPKLATVSLVSAEISAQADVTPPEAEPVVATEMPAEQKKEDFAAAASSAREAESAPVSLSVEEVELTTVELPPPSVGRAAVESLADPVIESLSAAEQPAKVFPVLASLAAHFSKPTSSTVEAAPAAITILASVEPAAQPQTSAMTSAALLPEEATVAGLESLASDPGLLPYGDTLPGLIVEFRNARGWTRDIFATKMNDEIMRRQAPLVPLSKDDARAWENHQGAPGDEREFTALASILYGEKESGEKNEYRRAYDEMAVWLKSDRSAPCPEAFGDMTYERREQKDKTFTGLANEVSAQAAVMPIQKAIDITSTIIGEIQAERRLVTRQFLQAAIEVFDREPAATGEAMPLFPADRERFEKAYGNQHVISVNPNGVPFGNTYVGLTMRLCDERGWTEREYAKKVAEEIQEQLSPIGKETIWSWAEFKTSPENWTHLNALAMVLIDNNPNLNEDKKLAREKYFEAFYNKEEKFGRLTRDYIDILDMTPKAVAAAVSEAMLVNANPKPEEVTEHYVVDVLAGRRDVPIDFYNASVDAFAHAPISDSDIKPEDYRDAYDRRKTENEDWEFEFNAAGSDVENGTPVRPMEQTPAGLEILILRNKLTAMFAPLYIEKTQESLSWKAFNKLLSDVGAQTISLNTYLDFFNINRDASYSSFGSERKEVLKKAFGDILEKIFQRADLIPEMEQIIEKLYPLLRTRNKEMRKPHKEKKHAPAAPSNV